MLYLDDDDILKLADPLGLVAAMESAFAGHSDMPHRVHWRLPGSDGAMLLVMPAWEAQGAIGIKVATVMPDNGARGRPTIDGLYVLLDGATGQPRVAFGASALTAVRTAAVSALASRFLSRKDARTLLMVGTGLLAPHLIRAHHAVRHFERIEIWGRDAAKAAALHATVMDLDCTVEVVPDLPSAVVRADVISVATSAPFPLIAGERVSLGTHVDLVGSFRPDMREADSRLFARGRLVVDTPLAFEESGELIVPMGEAIIDASTTPDLADLLCDRQLGRRSNEEITIFKTVGTGVADLAAAQWLHKAWCDANAAPALHGRRRSDAVETD